MLAAYGKPPEYPPTRTGVYEYHGWFRLQLGIVSTSGVVFWLALPVIGSAMVVRRDPGGAEEAPETPVEESAASG